MRILFIHQNFPGQFVHLAPALVARGHTVYALPMRQGTPGVWEGVYCQPYLPERGSTPSVHPWVGDFETKVVRAEACFHAALRLKAEGFSPDVIVAHHGWGESLFLKEVWPQARLGIYCEFFYHAQGCDVGFDPEFPPPESGESCRMRLKNLTHLLHFEQADGALAPTIWQASTFPESFRSRISVVHDGIDTGSLVPNPTARLKLNGQLVLSPRDEVITFVNRNLEPYRGFHVFMRALPEILQRRPQARVLIVGGDQVSYGTPPKQGTWKESFVNEVRGQISDRDWQRVHFLGEVPYPVFVAVLQLSTVHVYLTYPFVLSWSLLEAMSVGCAIVASDTAPVQEVLAHDKTGYLVPFFDGQALADKVCGLLANRATRSRLGANARTLVRAHYDLKTVCLPRQIAWVEALACMGKTTVWPN